MTAPEGKAVVWAGLSAVPEPVDETAGSDSPYERVLAALRNADCRQGSGQDWTCPAHEDSNPSLGVTAASDDRVLLCCGAGCTFDEVVAALGLHAADLAPPAAHPADYKITQKYPYCGESGELLYEVLRKECRAAGDEPCALHRKTFSQRAPGRMGRGALEGVRRVLYRLPELIAATEAGQQVYVVEGEKDADRLWEEGYAATTVAGGAGTPWQDQWSALLRGAAEVVVVPDRDRPGYAHAGQVYDSLVRAGVAHVRLALPGPEHKGADYSDHADAGGDVTTLLLLDRQTLAWPEDDPGEGSDEPQGVLRELDRLRVRQRAAQLFAAEQREAALRAGRERRGVDGAAFILDAPPGIAAVWGVDQDVLWADGEALLVVGPQGVGKSTVAQQLVLRRLGLRSDELFGYPVADDGRRVAYLAMDRPAQIRRSFARMVNEADCLTLLRRLWMWPGPLPFDPLADPRALADWLASEAGPDIGTVVVDSYKDLAPGLVNDETGSRVNQAMQEVISRGVQWVGLHHQRKPTGDNKRPNTLADVYGSGWLTAGVGSVVLLWGNPGAPTVELSHLKQPAAPVGPLTVSHDHATGGSEAADPESRVLALLTNAGSAGVSEEQVAHTLYGAAEPLDRRRAGRLLVRLADKYSLAREDGEKGGPGGGGRPARWRLT